MSAAVGEAVTGVAASADGTPIAWTRVGSGPAVVLVDGALCTREFGPSKDVAAALAGSYAIVSYDRRGRGESGDTQPYSVQREVEDLAAVIEAAGGDAYVAGQSSGAGLALEAAAAGVPIRRLASYEAPYVTSATGADHVAILRDYLARGENGKAVGHFMVKMVGAPAFVPLLMRAMPKVWGPLKATATSLPYDALVMDGFRVPTERFASIAVPTLVMGGGKAKADMAEAVRQVADAVPGSTRVTLPGQTHQVSPAVLAAELATFFR
ncbi:MAG: hydrolase [Microbacteriaceae bacterium]|nr:hydrolase [Microbacteriaceae bacterium]